MCVKGDACTYPSCNCFDNTRSKELNKLVWETKREYTSGSIIICMGQTWECTADHTSNIFGTDALENKYWKEWEYD